MTTNLAGVMPAWKDVSMPEAYPKEFRDDVVRVALNREPGVTLAQIATDFGVHPGISEDWLARYRLDAGEKAGVTTSENAELRALRRKNRLLEQEVEVLR